MAVGMTVPVVVAIAARMCLFVKSAVRFYIYRHYLFGEYDFSTENAADIPDAFLHGSMLRQVRADMREK
jgi:hypothetical protein